MPPIVCPRCLTELKDKSEWWSGGACECEKCKGILADKHWLQCNMHPGDYLRLSKRVSTGSPAGILCPHCLSVRPRRPIEMSKFTVSPGGMSFEVDGCLKCGSMWFDQGELESYEERRGGDPSLTRSEKKDPVETMGDVSNVSSAADAALGILDLLSAILTGF